MKDVKNTIDKLWQAMINYEWFAEKILVHPTLHNSIIVYVDRASREIYESVPDTFDGYDLRVHFVQSIGDKYAAKAQGSSFVIPLPNIKAEVLPVTLN